MEVEARMLGKLDRACSIIILTNYRTVTTMVLFFFFFNVIHDPRRGLSRCFAFRTFLKQKVEVCNLS